MIVTFIAGLKTDAKGNLHYTLCNVDTHTNARKGLYSYQTNKQSQVETIERFMLGNASLEEMKTKGAKMFYTVPASKFDEIVATGKLTTKDGKKISIRLDDNLKSSYKSSKSVLKTLGITKAEQKCYVTVLSEIYVSNSDQKHAYRSDERFGYRVIYTDGKGSRLLLLSMNKLAELIGRKNVEVVNCGVSTDTEGKSFLRFTDGKHTSVFMELGCVKPKVEVKEEKVKESVLKEVVETTVTKKKESPFTEEQLRQIALGRQKGIDYACYARPEISANRMSYIRVLLEHGCKDVVPLCKYAGPTMTDSAFEAYLEICRVHPITAFLTDRAKGNPEVFYLYGLSLSMQGQYRKVFTKTLQGLKDGEYFTIEDVDKHIDFTS